MRAKNLIIPSIVAVGAGVFLYGMLKESNELVTERRTLPLPGWPERLRGYRIAVIADLHLRNDPWSTKLAQDAVTVALEENVDMVVLPGDFVAYWKAESPRVLGEILEPLLMMDGNVVAVPGNHDYVHGSPEILEMILGELNIRLLRNESWRRDGVTWVGVDSAVAHQADPVRAMAGVSDPAICVWHEPDAVDRLPSGCALMLSGHSHGGQFRLPLGITPMHSKMGKKYPRGFYSEAPTPLYVSRGVGTTGPPSRFLCPPEVSILTLVPLHARG